MTDVRRDTRSILMACGVDYDEGVEKFMGETELYEGLLRDFLTENTFEAARDCLREKDEDGVLKNVHAMKSVTGTLSMNGLYRLCADTVEAVRDGDMTLAAITFEEAYRAYIKITEGIRKAGLA